MLAVMTGMVLFSEPFLQPIFGILSDQGSVARTFLRATSTCSVLLVSGPLFGPQDDTFFTLRQKDAIGISVS